jgi:hypothetical protein
MKIEHPDSVKNFKENVRAWHKVYLESIRKQKEYNMNIVANNSQISVGSNNIQKIKSSKKWIYISVSIPIICYLIYAIFF